MGKTAEIFNHAGYIKVESLIDSNVSNHIAKQLEFLYSIGDSSINQRDTETDCVMSGYSIPIMEHLMLDLNETLSRIVGKRLLPTYTYFRKYQYGNELKIHSDRPSCEISCTLCLDQTDVWPIHVGDSGPIELNPGDAVLYKGVDMPHWRDKFEGGTVTQVFIHYVDFDGPYQSYFMDRRGDIYKIGKKLGLY